MRSRPRMPRHARWSVLAVAIALLAIQHVYIGARSEFLPCSLDCGESYEAYIGAVNLARLGLRYAAGLQDLAVGLRPQAHPMLYIHNPNLGVLFQYVVLRLGARDIHEAAIWTVVPFALGLLYMYLFFSAATRSRLFGALCLLNVALLYLLVSLWAFQTLRVFSWLLTFGPLYHLYRASWTPTRRRVHYAAAGLFLALSFGIDYPFAVFIFLVVVGLHVVGVLTTPCGRLLLFLAAAFGVPFVLRQIQVAAGVGPAFWVTDFLYSVARRIELVGRFVSVPDEAALQALYRAKGVVAWPGSGHFAPRDWAVAIGRAYYEALGAPMLIVLCAWAAFMLAMVVRGRRRLVRLAGSVPVRAAQVIVVLVAAQTVTLLIFGDYVAGFYGKALMPLPVHWIVPMLGTTAWVLLANVDRVVRVGRLAVPAGAILLVLFVGWRVGMEARNHLRLPPIGYPGRHVLRGLMGVPIATLWDSAAVSAYTGEWAASLRRAWWEAPAPPPFDPDRDYYVFFQFDRDDPRYRHPRFLFVPALNIGVMADGACSSFDRRIATHAVVCADLTGVAARLAGWRLVERGPDYLLYDLGGP